MNEQCPAGIPSETVSAWRSRLLPPQEQQSITTHVADCLACQHLIAGFDRIAQLLRTPPRMPSQGAIWQGVQTAVAKQRGLKMHRPRTILMGLGAAAAVATAFMLVFIVFANRLSNSPSRPLWHPVQSVNYGQTVVFAQSDPHTGYVCGTPGGTAHTLELGVTHDGGGTWTTDSTTGIPGSSCSLSISPYDANDIVVVSSSYGVGSGSTGADLGSYRSLNGGKMWTSLIVPPGNEASGATIPASPVWTPQALFLLTMLPAGGSPTTAPTHDIAMSIQGGPLMWTPRNPTAPEIFSELSLFTLGNTLNATVLRRGNQIDLFTSTDNGTTWTPSTPQGPVPFVIQTAADGHTLVGYDHNNQVVISTNGGRTWLSLPVFPRGSAGESSVYTTPDGSFFSALDGTGNSSVQEGVYELAPGTTSWVLVAPLTSETQTFVAVSWESDGHPRLVWAIDGYPHLVLEFHPA